ncbi:helix-turn-helix domain-containing protein [Streptomyces sp. NPDC101175]|uniref:helix-turn-helix domain-containing protein n=1 Tax=Streptomyces sp. NPDC101175 TaxID=3366123 RepID=UPI0038359407
MADDSISGRKPQSIRSALGLLRAVAQAGPGVTARELAQATGLSSATTYRLLSLLEGDGYLVRLPDLRGFALGAKFKEIVEYVIPTVDAPPAQPPADQPGTGFSSAGSRTSRSVDGSDTGSA